VRRAVLVTLVVVLTAATAASSPPRLSFGYDTKAPLAIEDHGVAAHEGNVNAIDLSYVSGGKRLSAYLVEGPQRAHRPGIVLVPGSGGDRAELVERAIALAKLGAVVLAITPPSTAYPAPQPTTIAQLLSESKATQIADVVAVRRAGDVLRTLPGVGPKLGYLGWSAGAKTGTFVAASDPRFAALGLLSAGADKLSTFVAAAPKSARAAVERELGSVDPIRYVAWAKPGSLLLENGTKDTVVPHAALENIVHAAPKHTTVRWYPTGHALNDAAWADAEHWLLGRLQG